VANAEGDASRFKQVLEEYKKAPGVTRDRMYMETMQKIFENTSKVMIDAKSGSNLLYLPLDKLIQQTGADVANRPAAPTTGAAPNSAAGSEATYSADAQRDLRIRDARDARGRENR
jgi:membrane protease subunit HflK